MVRVGGIVLVSTHSRLKAAGYGTPLISPVRQVSTHSRLKAAGVCNCWWCFVCYVSTHSRLKAAGFDLSEWTTDR